VKTCPTCGAEWSDETRFCPNDGTTLRAAEGFGDLVGSVLADRYHIEKKLGEGGMGSVYLAEHVKMGRKSAIKVMAQAMASDPEAIARFNREAANAARINHPHVCGIYDFGETADGLIYLAMEYVEGEVLSEVLRRDGRLPPQRAAMILRQSADALQAAHDLGIVHRDLKPDNIMLARGRGGEDLVKVVDFGIAKAMKGDEGQKVTKTGLVVGTPEYMSPEQISGDVLDGRSDIYSLALVFYRTVTGTLPFHADTAQEMMIQRLTDEPTRLNAALPGAQFPPELQRAMDRALARMPGDRYDSAVAFARDAAAAVERMTPDAVTSVMDAPTQLLTTAATEHLPSTRISEPSGPGTRRPGVTPDTPSPRPGPAAPPRRRRWPVLVGAVVIIGLGGGGVMLVLNGGLPASPNGAAADDSVGPPASSTSGQQSGGDPSSTPEGNLERTPVAQEDNSTRVQGTPTPPEQPTGAGERQPLDAAELGRRIRALEDALVIEESTDPRLGDSLLLLYHADDLSNRDRAKVAYLIAYWYSAAGQGDTLTLCPWYRRADSLDPGPYEAQLRDFCQQD
jgi:serine/threonine-protein kinase